MKKLFVQTGLALAIATAMTPLVHAEQTTTPVVAETATLSDQDVDAVAAHIANSAAPEVLDPGLKLEQLIEEFEYSAAGQAFRSRPGMFYTTATAWVMSTPESRDWGNARIMAYKEALLKAQAKYIESLGVSIMAESMTKLYKDPTQMPQFSPEELRSPNKLLEMLDKAVAVTGGKLDNELRELGIDPEEFSAAAREKRAVLFERSVSERTVTRARQSLTGVIPVKSWEAYDENGNHAVAVAIVASERFRQFVYDVIHSKGDLAPDPSKALSMPLIDMLRKDRGALVNDFGIRRMYDEHGYPVLVSFGQSSNPYRGTEAQRRADARELSYAAARSDAYANFAYLFNSTGSSEQSSGRSMKRQTLGLVRAEGRDVTESEQETMEFVQTMDQEISARGSVSNLPGTRELFRWTASHPMHGHEINGVVYLWHPLAEQNARQLRNFKPTRNNQSGQAKATDRPTNEAGTSQSRNLMSADDF
jgi:hypothetical protein